MVIKCKEFECPIVFDGPEDFVLGQMAGHLKGTHGISATVDSLKYVPPIINEPTPEVIEPKIEVKPEIKIETVVEQPKTKTIRRARKGKK